MPEEVVRETFALSGCPLCLSRDLQGILDFEIILFHSGPNRNQDFSLES